MKDIVLNFEKKSFTAIPEYYCCEYPKPAAGWHEQVYYPRSIQITNNYPVKTDLEGLKMTNKSWDEIGAALNDDVKTCPHYTYAETVHLVLKVANANYQLFLTVANPKEVDQKVDIVINKINEKTILVPAAGQVRVKLEIALSQTTFDLSLITHNRPDNAQKAHPATVYLNYLKLEQQALKPTSTKIGIYIASDSTAQTYSLTEYPQSGWGAELYHQLKGKTVKIKPSSFYPQATIYEWENAFVDNRSMGARSSKSFILEARLEAILKDIAPGNYLLIQFGDNDATSYRPNRYVAPEKFAEYLEQYIDSALARKAIPILVSPPAQFKYNDQTKRFSICFDDYRKVMLQVSHQKNIPLIDLGKESTALLNYLGWDAAHMLYLQTSKADYPNLSEDKHDITHFCSFGAFALAKIIAQHLSSIIGAEYFELKEFKQDLRPIIDQRIGMIHLSWPEVKGAEFYVVKECGQERHYLATTFKTSIYVKDNRQKQLAIIPYHGNQPLAKELIIEV